MEASPQTPFLLWQPVKDSCKTTLLQDMDFASGPQLHIDSLMSFDALEGVP
jgi:hypothetical protein